MKTIRMFGNVAEAGFARSLLEAAGIQAVLADDVSYTLLPANAPWGIRLQVPDADVERAERILNEQEGFTPLPEDFVPPGLAPEPPVEAPRFDTATRPPAIVCLAAALSIVLGAGALVAMVASWLQGHLRIDFGLLGIPIGRGLLMGKASSRSWALGLSGFILLAMVGGLAWAEFSGRLRTVTSDQLQLGGIYLALTALVCATVFLGLRSAKAREWFAAGPSGQIDAATWTLPLVLIGLLFATESKFRGHVADTSLRSMFSVQTRFEFKDATTGKGLTSMNYGGDNFWSSAHRRDPLAPHVNMSTSARLDGLTNQLRGIAGRPFTIIFRPDGYHPQSVTIDDRTPEEVTLNFQSK